MDLSPSRLANIQAGSFDPRLGTHKIHALSAIFGRSVYAVVVEGDLRITFYIDGDTVITTNIGTHSIYRK